MATRLSTFNTDTELSSVNAILAAIGQSSVTELDFENPEVSMIHTILLECASDVQLEGWQFNTEFGYPMLPNDKGEIYLPLNVGRFDITEGQVYRTTDVVQRDGKLYDRLNHTYSFDQEKLYLDILWIFDYEDMPAVYRRYTTYKAASRAAAQLMMDPEQQKMLQVQEAYSRAACVEHECNQGDYTFFGTPPNTAYRSYQPYRTLAR